MEGGWEQVVVVVGLPTISPLPNRNVLASPAWRLRQAEGQPSGHRRGEQMGPSWGQALRLCYGHSLCGASPLSTPPPPWPSPGRAPPGTSAAPTVINQVSSHVLPGAGGSGRTRDLV